VPGFKVWSVVALVTLVGSCLDLRELSGEWRGARIGEAEELRVGFDDEVTLSLSIAAASQNSIEATASTSDGLLANARVAPVPGAEADVLSRTDFEGSPERVYFCFVETTDGGGDALALVAVFDDKRIEVRLLRGGGTPLYGIFPLHRR